MFDLVHQGLGNVLPAVNAVSAFTHGVRSLPVFAFCFYLSRRLSLRRS
ncbi:MAG: CRISPR-associated DxTHG motif protein [Ruminococcaceae bacterium]|nr:CRISPR-associated DxTHG motif protein [Oscillospiraceae bacterium]HBV73780.1 hypothetical protein [Oscillospiraceae bacterium]